MHDRLQPRHRIPPEELRRVTRKLRAAEDCAREADARARHAEAVLDRLKRLHRARAALSPFEQEAAYQAALNPDITDQAFGDLIDMFAARNAVREGSTAETAAAAKG